MLINNVTFNENLNFENLNYCHEKLNSIINFIYQVSLENLKENDINKIRFDSELNFIILLLNNKSKLDEIHNWKEYEDFFSSIIDQLDYHPRIKEQLLILNQKNSDYDELYLNAKEVYAVALSKFALLNVILPSKFKNSKHSMTLNDNYLAVLNANNAKSKLQSVVHYFYDLLSVSLENLTNETFFENSHIDLKNLFYILDLCGINSLNSILFQYLNKDQTETTKNALLYIFKELFNAYNLFPIIEFEGEKIVQIPSESKFLSNDLLARIISSPLIKDTTDLPFNLNLSYLYNLNIEKKIFIIKKDSTLLPILLKYSSYSDLNEKIHGIKTIYFSNFTREEISQQNYYNHILKFFVYPDLNQVEIFRIFDFLIQFYPYQIMQEICNPSIEFLNQFLPLPDNLLKNLLTTAIYHFGYTPEIARFNLEFNLFNVNEIISYIFSSDVTILNLFMNDINQFIPLTGDNCDFVFEAYIDYVKEFPLASNYIFSLFESLDSIADVTSSLLFIDKLSLLLVDKFGLESINLIPFHLVTEDLSLNVLNKILTKRHLIPNLISESYIDFFKIYIRPENFPEIPSSLSVLPNELQVHMASFLNTKDLYSLIQTSKSNHNLFKDSLDEQKNQFYFKNIIRYLLTKSNRLDLRISNNKTFFKPNYRYGLSVKFKEFCESIREVGSDVFNDFSKKIDNQENFSFIDQINILKILVHFFDAKYQLKNFNLKEEEINNCLDFRACIINIFEKLFEADLFDKDILIFLNLIQLKLPLNFLNKIICRHIDLISGIISEFYRDTFYDNRIDTELLKKIRNESLFNLETIIKILYQKEITPGYGTLIEIYCTLTQKHLDKSVLNFFLNRKPEFLNILISLNYPNIFAYRMSLVQDVFLKAKFNPFCYHYYKSFVDFLSINGDTSWIESHKNFLKDLNIEHYINLHLEKKYLNIDDLTYEQKKVLAHESVLKHGYTSFFERYINTCEIKFTLEELFLFGIHPTTDFQTFYKKFQKLKRGRDSLPITFENLNRYIEVYCINKPSSVSSYVKHIDFFTNIIPLNEKQKEELTLTIIRSLKLNYIHTYSKCKVFQASKRKNDPVFFSAIKILLEEKEQVTFFKKYRDVISELIGAENVTTLMPEISKKRKNPPGNAQTKTKRRKK